MRGVSTMPSTQFTPTRHGFHFANSFTNPVITLPGVGTINTYGLCGGMSFASLDYYHAGVPVPTHEGPDFPGGAGVPEVGSRLQQYIYDRQLTSFNPTVNPSIVKFVTQALPVGRTAYEVSVEDEWPLITQELDAGTPVPVGLIADSANPANSHQVVAIGYDEDPRQLHIYDCNHPDMAVRLVLDGAANIVNASSGETWLGFFLEQYEQADPTYVDVRLAAGITTNPSGATSLGAGVEVGFRVENMGDYDAHLAALDASMRGPGGEDMDGVFVSNGASADLTPGADSSYDATTDSFGTVAGTYELVAYYQSRQGEWFPVPAGVGAETTTTLEAS